MDRQSTSLKFAAIGHQDSWEKVFRFTQTLRDQKELQALSLQHIRDVYKYIPPRPLFDVHMHSSKSGACKGIYIETFIAPDELDAAHVRTNLKKVVEACQYAASQKIPIVSLGGFTSIVLESNGYNLKQLGDTYFTTGNTLTAGFIVKGVEKACCFWDQPLTESTLLIIGATGDIGSACTRYFTGKTKELILCARQPGPLQKQALALANDINVHCTTSINDALPRADIVICVASSLLENADISLLPHYAIICDAGYPKNIQQALAGDTRLFYGGMGMVEKGFHFDPDYTNEIYHFPEKNIVHGCLLEAIVLAMDHTPKTWSWGRGHITVDAINNILKIAAWHGIKPAPLFNASQLWKPATKIEVYESS